MAERLSAAHWRKRAAEARKLAEEMDDGDAKRDMLRVAADYEKLAEEAEALDHRLQTDRK